MLKIMADNYTNIESTPQGTFHMGNDRSRWKSKTRRDVGKGNDNDNDIMIRFCPSHPRIGSDALSVQNVINCGQWFLGNYSNSTLPLNQTSLFIPGFVRPGYEELYRLRYSNHLTYDTEGFPQRTEFQTPTKKTKAEGVLTRLNAAQEKRRKHAKAKRRRQLSVFKR